MPYGDGFAGVFRMDDITREQYLVTGKSKDGIHWELNNEKIFRGYDPGLCKTEDKFYLSRVCYTERGTSIGIASTEDFESWQGFENAVLPVSRNGVLFPRKINGEYMLFSRPCDKGHTPCAALADSETGRIAIYCGGADTVAGLTFTTVDETVIFIKEHDSLK